LRIPRDYERLDCDGCAIVAGFWNNHVHFFERKWSDARSAPAEDLALQLQEAFTRHGFTNVFDLGSPWDNTRDLRDRIESGELAGPRIRSTGEVVIARGAMPADAVLQALGDMVFANIEVASPADVFGSVERLSALGVDAIKIHLQSPRPPNTALSDETVRAAITAAHANGKRAFVHPNDAEDVVAALAAGVDVIAHTTPTSGAWTDAVFAAMRDGNAALTPTLALWKSAFRHDRVSTQTRLTDTAVAQLGAWVERGGRVLFGTDAGAADYDPTEEYALMQAAGMGFRDILASLTTSPAEHFGDAQRQGRVAVGFEADVVILGRDPAADVSALARVRYTIRGGKVVYRASE
jgi:imidazolonepropionase-like amidohydrolase